MESLSMQLYRRSSQPLLRVHQQAHSPFVRQSAVRHFATPKKPSTLLAANRTSDIPRTSTSTSIATRLRHSFTSSSSSPSSSRSSPSTTAKPIVLEPPDKFRPPSHASRLRARNTTGSSYSYGYGGGGYNQGTTDREREQQRERSYPHMFPNEGTFMHWFLTNKMIHVWISMGVLTTLALTTLTQSFVKTSPFSHLIPPLSLLPFHPITYISEYFSVVKLHIDYTTEQAAESRRQNILDAQKRRLYRRAHGMEDLDAKHDQGIDVRGLVPWDDGLTNRERERGGRKQLAVSGREVFEEGGKEALAKWVDEKEGRTRAPASASDVGVKIEETSTDIHGSEAALAEDTTPKRRRVKRWLGIWE